jgi:hypothetical protein
MMIVAVGDYRQIRRFDLLASTKAAATDLRID